MKSVPNAFDSDKISTSYLSINDCATLMLGDKDYHIERPNGRSDYLFIYIAKGKGHVIINGKDNVVNEREAFIYRPHEPQNYHFFKKDFTINYWVHFSGTECNNILSALQLNSTTIIKTNILGKDVEQLFLKMCQEFYQKSLYYEQICAALLINILSITSRSISQYIHTTDTSGLLEQVIGLIHSEDHKDFQIKDIARVHGISTDHLIRIFKKSLGVTPAQYIIDCRMSKAKELLLSDNYNITEIAQLLGYQNYSYFSRSFKQHVGICPSEFKSSHQK